ncbi:phosphonate metabolism transcriptional regulator PhnF [Spirochaetia bacterium]|nr:phosphonate metabolism transcriptional regulator PhnF [Spirochaetia bacterium]
MASLLTVDYFKQSFKFIPGSSSPLYIQLISYIRMQIQAAIFKPGDKMISENELCDILNVSRTTIRQSMNRLVDEGLLVRYRGKGSYIANQKLRRNINYMYNFTENIHGTGAVPSSIVLQKEVGYADQIVCDKLQLPQNNNRVFFLSRLRCADNEPILLENTYIPYYLCEGIEAFDFSTVSLYYTLSNQYSLNLFHAEETIEAVIISGDTEKMLKCKGRMPGYKIQRVSYLESDYIFEYTTSITRADKCIFRLDLYKNNNSAKKNINFERQLQIQGQGNP